MNEEERTWLDESIGDGSKTNGASECTRWSNGKHDSFGCVLSKSMKEKSQTVPSVHRSSKGFSSLDRLPSSSMRTSSRRRRRSTGPLASRWVRRSTCSEQTVDAIPAKYSQTMCSRDLDVDLDENLPSSKTRLCSYPPCSSTTIQLSLPVRSSLLQCSRRSRADVDVQEGFNDHDDDDEEFTLPTHPPITVTIQGQSSRSLIDRHHHGFHADQIFSPDHVYRVNDEQRIHLDTASLKGASTIVTYFMDLLKPSDNKLAMKLFGSRKGVLKERLRQQRAGHCIIHPCSNFRFVSPFSFSFSSPCPLSL